MFVGDFKILPKVAFIMLRAINVGFVFATSPQIICNSGLWQNEFCAFSTKFMRSLPRKTHGNYFRSIETATSEHPANY